MTNATTAAPPVFDSAEELVRSILATAPDAGVVEVGLHPSRGWYAIGRWSKPHRAFAGYGDTMMDSLRMVLDEIAKRKHP